MKIWNNSFSFFIGYNPEFDNYKLDVKWGGRKQDELTYCFYYPHRWCAGFSWPNSLSWKPKFFSTTKPRAFY